MTEPAGNSDADEILDDLVAVDGLDATPGEEPLEDPQYSYSVDGGFAYVYRIGVEPPDYVRIVETSGRPDGETGTVPVTNGQLDFTLAQIDDPYAWWRTPAAETLIAVREAVEGGADVMRQLCASGESAWPMPFLATTNYVIFGEPNDFVANFLYHVALHGEIYFTRNRTKPNVFSIENTWSASTPPDFPTTYTGVGGAIAIPLVFDALRANAKRPGIYPYRDGSRIQVQVVS